jgi:phosphate transport system substrate-binding protein
LALPRLKVTRVVRQDSSGSTAIFTEYLSKNSTTWANTGGTGKQIKWKGDVMAAVSTAGVTEALKATPGAISYISFDRVLRDGLSAVSLRNKAGQFIAPSETAFQAAVKASAINKSESLTASLVDMDGAGVWPIVDLTYILLDNAPKSNARATASAKFFYWAFLKGDTMIKGTGFAALPTEIQARVIRKLSEIKPQDGRPLNFTRHPQEGLFSAYGPALKIGVAPLPIGFVHVFALHPHAEDQL